jgi:hypothetical protein
MELASMLAGEEFSDHPQSVSPVLTRFLRAYNDRVDDQRRQDLFGYASRVVGTRASRAVERSRAARCVEWVVGSGGRVAPLTQLLPGPAAGALAAKHAAEDASAEGHRHALVLLDELISFADGWAGVPADASGLAGEPKTEIKRL